MEGKVNLVSEFTNRQEMAGGLIILCVWHWRERERDRECIIKTHHSFTKIVFLRFDLKKLKKAKIFCV